MTFSHMMEMIGYIGTACVILSMLMTSLVRLRIINLCGALLSMLYAISAGAYPVILLNAALIIIQIVQLFLARRKNVPSARREKET